MKIIKKYFPWIPVIGVGWLFLPLDELCLKDSIFHYFGSAFWQAFWLTLLFCWLVG